MAFMETAGKFAGKFARKYGKFVAMGASFIIGMIIDAYNKREQEEYIDEQVEKKVTSQLEAWKNDRLITGETEEETEESADEESSDEDEEQQDEEA